jgi:pimeloyl-ACP methyl ester carboxylesterase
MLAELLSKKHRVFALSLRRFFPEHWDGVGNDYLMAQHTADVIGFIEKLNTGPVDLLGHSRGGHIGFRVAQARPDLLRKAILAEPGGDLEPALQPATPPPGPVPLGPRVPVAAGMVRNGDIDGALALFVDGIDGEGAWARWPAAPRQQLRDNARGNPIANTDPQGRMAQAICAVAPAACAAALEKTVEVCLMIGTYLMTRPGNKKWQACHDRCLDETGGTWPPSDRPGLYRRCMRKCLGPNADY